LPISATLGGATLGSVSVNFNGAALTGVTTALTNTTLGVTEVLAPTTVAAVTGTDTLTVTKAPTAPGIVGLNVDGNPMSLTLAGSETAAQTADAIVVALNANTYVTTNYTVSAAGATVTLLENTPFTNKKVTFQAGTTGATATSTQAPAGVTGATAGDVLIAAVPAQYNFAVSAVNSAVTTSGTLNVTFSDGTINKTLQVGVTAGDSQATVATAIVTALTGNAAISAAYTITDNGDGTVTILQNVGKAVTLKVTVKG